MFSSKLYMNICNSGAGVQKCIKEELGTLSKDDKTESCGKLFKFIGI